MTSRPGEADAVRTGQMSRQQLNLVRDGLLSRNALSPCLKCGESGVEVLPYLHQLQLGPSPSPALFADVLSKPSMPLNVQHFVDSVVTICQQCGHLDMFALDVLVPRDLFGERP